MSETQGIILEESRRKIDRFINKISKPDDIDDAWDVINKYIEERGKKIDDLCGEIDRKDEELEAIINMAHEQSTGPALPDPYWTIKWMAERALSTEEAIDGS